MVEKKQKRAIASSGSELYAELEGVQDSTRRGDSGLAKALMNADVLHLIFEHFDLQLQRGSYSVAQTTKNLTQIRKDLLSAAKTCKAFVEPALNSLWRVLPSLLPLLLLLPSAEVEGGHYFVDDLPLDDDPSRQESSGWERFDFHARRVRILYMEAPRVIISPDIYIRILAMRDSPLLRLPGLNEICIHYRPLDLSSALFLASRSSLNTVQVHDIQRPERQSIILFLSTLYAKSPGLARLYLSGAINVSLKYVYRFTRLQSLELSFFDQHVDPQLLQKLGQLGDLLDLCININRGDFVLSHTNAPSTTYPNFRKLRKLHVVADSRSINHILAQMKGLANLTILKIFEFRKPIARVGGAWRCFFEIISTFSAVEEIDVTTRDRQDVAWLSPLFRLDNMRSFVINWREAWLSGSDDDFRLLARAFPKLRRLVVPPANYDGTGRTLACLYHFSRECADLLEIKIGLSFDISENLDAIKKVPHPIVRNCRHPLQKLYIHCKFGQLQPTHSVQVAHFLDLIFPNLSTLEFVTDDLRYDSNKTEVANWAGIQEVCLYFQQARLSSASDI